MSSTDDAVKGQGGNDSHHWLAVYRSPGMGGQRLLKLLESFSTPGAILNASGEQLKQAGIPREAIDHLKQPDWKAVETDLEWLGTPGNHLLTIRDRRYPRLLAEIPDPPPLLFVHGDIDYLSQPQLAMVGSRNPSHAGAAIADEFAEFLAGYGLTICSGLAAGIDAAAHRGGLRTTAGTVAVTGTGLDRVYPARHRDLAHEIADNGVLVSEFPPGTPPLASNFPRRNRIISGLSLGTLVVEAATRSGSLITAKCALEQGREVFAIPGSIHNPQARGCHALIRQGAKLVETAAHILEELAEVLPALAPQTGGRTANTKAVPDTSKASELDAEYRQLLETMGYAPVSVDELVTRSGLTPEQVSSMLLLLELEDRVHSSSGGRYTRST